MYNPYTERSVKSIKDECLRNFVFLPEGMFRKAIRKSVPQGGFVV